MATEHLALHNSSASNGRGAYLIIQPQTMCIQVRPHNARDGKHIEIHMPRRYTLSVLILAEVDVFHLFRGLLALVCVIYVLITTIRTLNRWFGPTDPGQHQRLRLKRYLITQLLRVKTHRFSFDLLQIGILLALFCYLITLHP